MQTPHVSAEIRAEKTSAQPQTETWIGLRLNIIPRWHVYWLNPGDSGLPTKVQWTLPDGWEISDIQWPIPSRIKLLPLVNFGFDGDVLFGFKLKIPKDASGKKVISAKASWLVCKESCIPEKADLDFTVDVSPHAPMKNPWSISFDLLRGQQPQKNILQASIKAEDDKFNLVVSDEQKILENKKLDFFPYDSQILKTDDVESKREGNSVTLQLNKSDPFNAEAKSLRGILVTEEAALKKSFEVDLPLPTIGVKTEIAATAGEKAKSVPPTAASPLELILSVVFAFLGGIILNLMPCVFPVLGIKVMSLANHQSSSRKYHGEVYTVGVLCSFWLLTAILLSVRGAGESIGWGFQLQQPGFVITLVFLFTIMSANLAGLFEFGGRWMGAGSVLAAKDGYVGTFFTGVLAVIVATPCTAPFMGAAIGAALSQPAWGVFLIFTFLGLGLAFPFLLFSFFPQFLKFLPKPGRWMEVLKKLFSIPMLLTVVWLIWVLDQQLGSAGINRVLGALLILAFALFIHKRSRGQGGKLLAFVFLMSSLSFAYSAIQVKQARSTQAGVGWENFSEETLNKALAKSQPVFIDFTAAWCLTCQVNERVVLEKESMKSFFKENNILLLKADWTNNDPAITAMLERHGRIGVPLYLAYAKGSKEAKILPQILTETIIKESF